MNTTQEWDPYTKQVSHISEYYTKVLEKKAIPIREGAGESTSRTLHYVYKFPLEEAAFVDNVDAPNKTKVLRLNSSNISTFEERFQTYYNEELPRRVYTNSYYDIILPRVLGGIFFKTEQDMTVVKEFLVSKGFPPEDLNPNKYKKYVIRAILMKMLNDKTPRPFKDNTSAGISKKFTTVNLDPSGFTGDVEIARNIRLIEYGRFLEVNLEPNWGGIHYDESLFTDELKSKYIFLEYVELTSGCLWTPALVMPGYIPTPIAVLGIANTKENAMALEKSVEEKYKTRLYIAGVDSDGLFLFKSGEIVGGRKKTRRVFRKGRRIATRRLFKGIRSLQSNEVGVLRRRLA
jgi:hypothetical protein